MIEFRIAFTQSGGFAGCRKACEVGSAALGKRARAALRAAWSLGPVRLTAPPGGDLMAYRIVLRRGREKRELFFNDLSLPTALRPLIRFLLKNAEPV